MRYVQWVLTQTSKWTPDTNRVYVEGASMGGGGSLHIALLYPSVFSAANAMTAWIDDGSWAGGLGDCQAGVKWKTATGPNCLDMLDAVYLVDHPQGQKRKLFLTWNSNDGTINPSRYPTLLGRLEAASWPYQAEWHQEDHEQLPDRGRSDATDHLERGGNGRRGDRVVTDESDRGADEHLGEHATTTHGF